MVVPVFPGRKARALASGGTIGIAAREECIPACGKAHPGLQGRTPPKRHVFEGTNGSIRGVQGRWSGTLELDIVLIEAEPVVTLDPGKMRLQGVSLYTIVDTTLRGRKFAPTSTPPPTNFAFNDGQDLRFCTLAHVSTYSSNVAYFDGVEFSDEEMSSERRGGGDFPPSRRYVYYYSYDGIIGMVSHVIGNLSLLAGRYGLPLVFLFVGIIKRTHIRQCR